MKVGIFIALTSRSMDIAVLAKHAEDLGFESCWVPEHIAVPAEVESLHPRRFEDSDYKAEIPEFYWQIMDPFVALSRASAVTSKIMLGTSVCLIPQYHPLHLAKLVSTLDTYASGRFLFGIGTGWLQEESEVFGVDVPHRWTQAREALQVMQQVWAGDTEGFHGRYYHFPAIKMEPIPVQKPRPPIYIGGSPANIFKRLVNYADGWLAPRLSVEDARTARATLDQMSQNAGREAGCINVTVFGLPDHSTDPDLVQAYEESGVDRVIPWLTQTNKQGALKEMEKIARNLIR